MKDVVPQIEQESELPAEMPLAEQQPVQQPSVVEPPVAEMPASRSMTRVVGIALIVVAVVLGWLLLVGYLGYQSGQRKLIADQQNQLISELERQVTLADENITQGNIQLALSRVAWILEREPDNQAALALKAKIDEVVNETAVNQTAVLPTPLPPDATPTAIPEPSPIPGQIASPEQELQRIRRLNVNKEWAEAVPALVAFQQQFPSYEREETDRLLFEAYLGYGQMLLDNRQDELGLFYLSQAEKLGALPQAMRDYQTWAELYTQGIAYYGVNWDVAAYYFRDLCLAAPFYQDSCTRLNHILVAYGDQNAAVLEWCPALALYEEAARQSNDPELAGKLDNARNGCLSATPTGTFPITGTVPITGTQPITGTLPLPGSFVLVPTPTP